MSVLNTHIILIDGNGPFRLSLFILGSDCFYFQRRRVKMKGKKMLIECLVHFSSHIQQSFYESEREYYFRCNIPVFYLSTTSPPHLSSVLLSRPYYHHLSSIIISTWFNIISTIWWNKKQRIMLSSKWIKNRSLII